MVEWSSEGTSTAEPEVANDVIKYLRWRTSDGSGMVASEFTGVAFDIAEPLSREQWSSANWLLVTEGQVGGYRLSHTAVFFFTRLGQ